MLGSVVDGNRFSIIEHTPLVGPTITPPRLHTCLDHQSMSAHHFLYIPILLVAMHHKLLPLHLLDVTIKLPNLLVLKVLINVIPWYTFGPVPSSLLCKHLPVHSIVMQC